MRDSPKNSKTSSGGFTLVDGVVLKESTEDLFDSNALDVDTRLQRGAHTLEVYGAEDCCDDDLSWKFAVNDGDEEEFTLRNL